MDQSKSHPGKVDIEKLKAEHPNDPREGQGFNDQRGNVDEEQEKPTYRNIKNNLGPEQKKHKNPGV
jgi:hypothetical protein